MTITGAVCCPGGSGNAYGMPKPSAPTHTRKGETGHQCPTVMIKLAARLLGCWHHTRSDGGKKRLMLTVVEGLGLRPNSLFAILPLAPLLWRLGQGLSVQALSGERHGCDSRIIDGRNSFCARNAKGPLAKTFWCPGRLEMARLLDTELVTTLRGGEEGAERGHSFVAAGASVAKEGDPKRDIWSEIAN